MHEQKKLILLTITTIIVFLINFLIINTSAILRLITLSITLIYLIFLIYLNKKFIINLKKSIIIINKNNNSNSEFQKKEIYKLQENIKAQKQGIKIVNDKNIELIEQLHTLNNKISKIEHQSSYINIMTNNSPFGIIAVDLERKIIEFNLMAANITGYTKEQALGKNLNEIIKLFNKDEQIPIQNYCPVSFSKENIYIFSKNNLKLVGQANHTAFVNIHSQYIPEGGEYNLGNTIIIEDVTKSQDLEKMKLDFVSMAAHELRTPLTTVQGYLSMVNQPTTTDKLEENEKTFLNQAFQSSVRLNKLIENLLEVSRLEQGRMTIMTKKADITPIIEQVCKDLTLVAEKKGLKIIYTKPTNKLPEVMIDSIKIEEVLNNLIGNAIKYTEKGEIKVFTNISDNFVIVSVSDTGAGIPEHAKHHLFTKFYRVESNITAGAKGTGLGLYVTKNIIESHGGNIQVESVVGKGSIFSFSIPIA